MQTGKLDVSEFWKMLKRKYEEFSPHFGTDKFKYYQTVKDDTQINLVAVNILREAFYNIFYPEGNTSDGLTLEQTLDLL